MFNGIQIKSVLINMLTASDAREIFGVVESHFQADVGAFHPRGVPREPFGCFVRANLEFNSTVGVAWKKQSGRKAQQPAVN